MTLSEFKQTANQPTITDSDTIDALIELFCNMPIKDMYAKGVWETPTNPIESGYFSNNPQLTYADLVQEVSIYKSEINPDDIDEYNNLLRLISEECVYFTKIKYNKKKELPL